MKGKTTLMVYVSLVLVVSIGLACRSQDTSGRRRFTMQEVKARAIPIVTIVSSCRCAGQAIGIAMHCPQPAAAAALRKVISMGMGSRISPWACLAKTHPPGSRTLEP